ncbi:unnamed protein product [Arctia plantaginis]|uniref:Odorant receptor n=1 Tax=Arctia plantaginis TaxID=874455 RepID=A0A8S0ZP85_ARCPL|nr:unnamed protein product [Arctia plantaginis]
MDMLSNQFRTLISKINYVEDPVEAAKKMVSSIQQLVGIRNVFGDKKRSLSPKYETPFYEITFAVTCVATAFSAVNQTGYIVLFITLVAHELGHFYAITKTLNEIFTILKNPNGSELNSEEIEDSINQRLIFCVKQHQFLIYYHYKIRKLYKVVFGAHFVMMTVVLVTTLQTMNEWDGRNTILTGVTGIMPLFLYCFGGELLISAGQEMSTSIYTCGWELMEARQAKIVILMLCLAQRPLYLSAAGVFIMNRETFGGIVQVVYKIYAVFN